MGIFKKKDILGPPTEAILDLVNDDQKKKFSKALRDSINLDMKHKKPRPASPHEIEESHGISLEDQINCYISLTKIIAMDFLKAYGKKIKESSFKKKYNKKYYEDFFNREVAIVNRKLLFTYAELLHMVEYEFKLDFPERLRKFLR